ncbi:MAG: aldehyde dehydrogenase [Paracoccaceae bacterium]|nr:MAG: aldehyde dehydrogenase [Paracoccaceae bacterium]
MLNQKQIDSYRDKKISPQKLFIDGAWIDGSGDDFEIVSPINGKKFTSIKRATVSDMEMAIKAARMSFDNGSWSNMAPTQRKKILHKLADFIERDALELTVLGVRDNGTEINMAINAEAGSAAGTFRYYAECIDKVYGEIAPTANNVLGLIHKEPVGVVGAIVPWNFPLMIGAWKVAPALAAGNSIVLKPAETASLSLLKLAELAAEAGVPDGVLNVVTGQGSVVGKAMGLSMEVDVLAFTGSGPTGRRLLEYSSQSNMKRCYLELGGKSPNIIFSDAPSLEQAAKVSAMAIFRNSGQVCVAASRLIIEDSIHDDFIKSVIENAEELQVGNPLDLTSDIGAINSETQLSSNLQFVDIAKTEGSQIAIGGNQILKNTGGYYMEPTVITNVKPNSTLFKEEVFGPVLAVSRFKTEEEAVTLANGTEFGLSAGIWTSNLAKAHKMVSKVKAGVVNVNTYGGADVTVPLSGVKQSGNGSDKSLHALDKYINLKTAWIQL